MLVSLLPYSNGLRGPRTNHTEYLYIIHCPNLANYFTRISKRAIGLVLMILLSKTETLFARTHVSYPTPRIHVNEINECTSREYLTKYKVYNATNVNKKK